jgi:hypothetical protein
MFPELQQCYKPQHHLSEQLVVEVAESRALKAIVQEKEAITQTRRTCSVVLRNEDGAEFFLESSVPSVWKHMIHSHEGAWLRFHIVLSTILAN